MGAFPTIKVFIENPVKWRTLRSNGRITIVILVSALGGLSLILLAAAALGLERVLGGTISMFIDPINVSVTGHLSRYIQATSKHLDFHNVP
jgi:hypothetical protein